MLVVVTWFNESGGAPCVVITIAVLTFKHTSSRFFYSRPWLGLTHTHTQMIGKQILLRASIMFVHFIRMCVFFYSIKLENQQCSIFVERKQRNEIGGGRTMFSCIYIYILCVCTTTTTRTKWFSISSVRTVWKIHGVLLLFVYYLIRFNECAHTLSGLCRITRQLPPTMHLHCECVCVEQTQKICYPLNTVWPCKNNG